MGQVLESLRFWATVDKADDCWLWMGRRNTCGYGVVNIRRADGTHSSVYAHRYAWRLERGPIPDGLLVCHRCDAPRCVRPDHLFLGTQAENMADCSAKGRAPAGARNGKAKLTEAQVDSIRDGYQRGLRQRKLAAVFGVDQSTISDIVTNRSWPRRRSSRVVPNG